MNSSPGRQQGGLPRDLNVPGVNEVHKTSLTTEFTSFFRSEYPRLVAYLTRLGARWFDALDAAQRAMIMLYQNWDTVTNPRAWSRTVARRELVKLTARLAAEIPTNELSDVNPQTHVDRTDESLQVADTLRGLSPRQRQVMFLTIDGYKPNEIASILGLHTTTVSSYLVVARRVLRGHLLSEDDTSL